MKTPSAVKGLARTVADKLVYASTAYVSLKSTVNQLSDHLVGFSSPPAGQADQRLAQAVAMLRPVESATHNLGRVGGDGDGGYLMALPISADGAISIGVGPDVSWDQSIGELGIPVYLFDPTIRRLPAPVVGGSFHRVGIGPHTSGSYATLEDLTAQAGLMGSDQILLKIDVEGAEWESLARVRAEFLEKFSQVAIELHGLSALTDAIQGERILQVLGQLSLNHAPIHIHANNYSELCRFDSYWFPDTVEVSYLRRDTGLQLLPTTRIASELDRPCDPRVPEISLEGILNVPPKATFTESSTSEVD